MAMTIGSILLGALLLQPVPATQPATAPAEAERLIVQLGSDDINVRDAAQAALMDLDGNAADFVRAARYASSDPDVQLRLDSILVHYAENAAVGATRITLKFDDAPLKDVLSELARQSKANFSDPVQEFGNDPPHVTIHVENVSFWQALNALQSSGNLNIFPQPDNWRVTRNFGNPLFSDNSIEAGAFLIQPMAANYQRSVGYTRNMGGGETFSIQMQMLTEPKIRLAQASGQFRLTRAVDSNGNNLAGPNSLQNFGTGVGQSQIHIVTQLVYPKNPGEKITELTGSLKLNMARRVETISVDDFNASSKSVEQTIEGAKITIAPGDANAGQPSWLSATITVESQDDPTLLQRMMMVVRQVRVVDQNGRLFQINGFNSTQNNAQRAEYKITFMPLGNAELTGPYRLMLDVPTSFREVEVPFTLRDLKMP